MRVLLHYQGIVGDLIRPKVKSVDLPDDATMADLINALGALSEKNAAILKQAHAVLDGQLAERSTPLRDGVTVTLMRPISGG